MKTELEEAWAAADEYELLWHRAREGARGAQRGLERAHARLRREREVAEDLRLDLAHERSMRAKAEAEARSLEKKVQRLSLKILQLWGAE